jgi:polyphosphate glucokinase
MSRPPKPTAARSPAHATPNAPGDGPPGLRTLCVDIGGSHVKALVASENGTPLTERSRAETPRPATPARILAAIGDLLKPLGRFDRVSCGFPGVVVDGVTRTAPNLHEEWTEYPLARALEKMTGRPVRALNDAGVQGYGVIEGQGVEMLITLGTGMGCALFMDGVYVPNLELAHHPFRSGATYEEYVGMRALEKVGKKKWNRRVLRVVAQIEPVWNPRRLYVGGGNAELVTGKLPTNATLVSNVAGLLGGIALWRGPVRTRAIRPEK